MIEQQARVTQLFSGKAVITLSTVSGCPACDAGKGCGAGIFGRLAGRKSLSLELQGREGLAVGQPVVVGIPESLYLSLLARLYLLPLLASLAGAAAGHYLADLLALQGAGQDLLALLGALILFALTLPFRKTAEDGAVANGQVRLLREVPPGTVNDLQSYCQRPTG